MLLVGVIVGALVFTLNFSNYSPPVSESPDTALYVLPLKQDVLPPVKEVLYDSTSLSSGYRPEENHEQPRQELEQDFLRAFLRVPGAAYEVAMKQGRTAYDLMVATASKRSDFSFSGREFSGLGFYVEEINGLRENHGQGLAWIYYINGAKAPVGVSNYIVRTNDVIEWKYEEMEM